MTKSFNWGVNIYLKNGLKLEGMHHSIYDDAETVMLELTSTSDDYILIFDSVEIGYISYNPHEIAAISMLFIGAIETDEDY